MAQAKVILHPETFNYLQPTADQIDSVNHVREAAMVFAEVLIATVPDGPDKTYLLRKLREVGMWANIAITRQADGTPRVGR